MSVSFLSRRLLIATGIALAVGAVSMPAGQAAPAHAAGTAPAAAVPDSKRAHDDFNGDGYPDVAVGAPYSVVDGHELAGAVSVLFGGPGGIVPTRKQIVTWPDRSGLRDPESQYGTDMHSADLDHDGFADLISRVWSLPADGDQGTTVVVNWGSRTGLSRTATILAPVPGEQGNAGAHLAVGDVDGDGAPDIAIADDRDGGHVLHGPFTRSGGWKSVTDYTLGDTDVLDTGDITIGDVTGDGVGDLALTGFGPDDPWQQHTFVLPGGSSGFGTPVGLPDATGEDAGGNTLGIADLNGDGYGDVVAGHSDEWPGVDAPQKKGGALFISYGGPTGRSGSLKPVWINQDSTDVSGVAEDFDRMGDSLAFGDTDGDGYLDLVTGLPGENVTGTADAGRVLVFKGGAEGVSGAGSEELGQYTAGVPGTVEEGDGFGEGAVSLGDFNRDGRAELVVGDPSENLGNGALWGFASDATGIIAKGSFSFGAATLGAPSTGAGFSASLTD